MLQISIIKDTHNLTDTEFNYLLGFVSNEKKNRISNTQNSQDAKNMLLGDVLARKEISSISKIDEKNIKFSTNLYGKPYLVDNPNIYFNISHSGNYIVCAISDKPVGIDIEIIKPANLKIAKRFFTTDEYEYVMENQHDYRFYEIWTKKESITKMLGRGLHMPLSSFSVLNLNKKQFEFYNVYIDKMVICHTCSCRLAEVNVKTNVKTYDTNTFLDTRGD